MNTTPPLYFPVSFFLFLIKCTLTFQSQGYNDYPHDGVGSLAYPGPTGITWQRVAIVVVFYYLLFIINIIIIIF